MTTENETLTEPQGDSLNESESTTIETESRPETVEETISKVIAETKAKDSPTGTTDKPERPRNERGQFESKAKEGTSQENQQEGQSQQKAGEETSAQIVEKIPAPSNFSAEGKEWFYKQPIEAQREFAKVSRELLSHSQAKWQELNRGIAETKEIKNIIDHYAPKWGLQGVDAVRGFSELGAVWENIRQNPIAGIDHLLRQTGITPEQLYEYRQKGGTTSAPQNQQQQSLPVDPRVDELYNYVNGQIISQGVRELESLRDERDQSGRFLWPELHDPQSTTAVQRLMPYVSEINPGKSLAERTKLAVQMLRAQNGTNGHLTTSQNLPPQQQTNTVEKARAAAVSVRGRGSVPPTPMLDPDKIPLNQKTEDTLRMVMNAYARDRA